MTARIDTNPDPQTLGSRHLLVRDGDLAVTVVVTSITPPCAARPRFNLDYFNFARPDGTWSAELAQMIAGFVAAHHRELSSDGVVDFTLLTAETRDRLRQQAKAHQATAFKPSPRRSSAKRGAA